MGILGSEIKHSFAGQSFRGMLAGFGFTFADAVVTLFSVSKKSGRIAVLIDGCKGRDLDPHYLGYFACFNQGLFYDSHDVLEELWLEDRNGPNGAFYKGLIQFAGAFVHLQKDSPAQRRLRPAAALFKLARTNLTRFSGVHERLDVSRVLALIEEWLGYLEGGEFTVNPLRERDAPRLAVQD